MKNNIRQILMINILVIGICSMISGTITADELDIEVTIDPEEPLPESTVTFTVEVDDENITGVWLNYNECKSEDLCYVRQNISMNHASDDTYEATIDLEHDDATYVQYFAP